MNDTSISGCKNVLLKADKKMTNMKNVLAKM